MNRSARFLHIFHQIFSLFQCNLVRSNRSNGPDWRLGYTGWVAKPSWSLLCDRQRPGPKTRRGADRPDRERERQTSWVLTWCKCLLLSNILVICRSTQLTFICFLYRFYLIGVEIYLAWEWAVCESGRHMEEGKEAKRTPRVCRPTCDSPESFRIAEKKTWHAKGLSIEVCLRAKRRAQLLKVVCWDFRCFAVGNRDFASQIVTVQWYHVRCRSCDASSSHAGDEFGSWAACPEDLSALFCVQIQTSRRFDWNQVGLNNGKIWKTRENPVVCEHKARHKALESVSGAKSIADGGVSATSNPSDQGPNHVIARDVNGKRLPCFGMRSRGSVWLATHVCVYNCIHIYVGLKMQTWQFAAACSQTAWRYQTKLRIGFS